MLGPEQRRRYLRHILLKEVGAQGQQKLAAAKIVVVGAGGLGAPIIQYLAAAGIGALEIVDDDVVDVSNLQRQVIFATDDIGASKAERAAAAARAINPDCAATAHSARVAADNADGLIASADLVIEGVDNFDARFVLNRACMVARVPLVSAAIGGYGGQVAAFAPYAGDHPCYRCLVPDAPPADVAVNCLEQGVLGPVPGILGSMAALEALKLILGLGEPLIGRLLIYDGLSQEARRVTVPRDPACPDCGGLERPDDLIAAD